MARNSAHPHQLDLQPPCRLNVLARRILMRLRVFVAAILCAGAMTLALRVLASQVWQLTPLCIPLSSNFATLSV